MIIISFSSKQLWLLLFCCWQQKNMKYSNMIVSSSSSSSSERAAAIRDRRCINRRRCILAAQTEIKNLNNRTKSISFALKEFTEEAETTASGSAFQAFAMRLSYGDIIIREKRSDECAHEFSNCEKAQLLSHV